MDWLLFLRFTGTQKRKRLGQPHAEACGWPRPAQDGLNPISHNIRQCNGCDRISNQQRHQIINTGGADSNVRNFGRLPTRFPGSLLRNPHRKNCLHSFRRRERNRYIPVSCHSHPPNFGYQSKSPSQYLTLLLPWFCLPQYSQMLPRTQRSPSVCTNYMLIREYRNTPGVGLLYRKNKEKGRFC